MTNIGVAGSGRIGPARARIFLKPGTFAARYLSRERAALARSVP